MQTITQGSITAVRGLEERPVYFVTLNGAQQPQLVVKGENKPAGASADEVKASARWASKMMKNVQDPLVNAKALEPAEWSAFRKFALIAFPPGSNRSRNLQTSDQYVWMKMPYVANLTDADFVTSSAHTDQSAVKEVLRKFLIDANWLQLGKVVAVDLFTSNFDRFILQADGSVIWGNRGNIMFAGGVVIGLDPYFADKGGAGGDANLNSAQLSPLVKKGLDILKDPLLRPAFALSCVRAVSSELNTRMNRKMQGQKEVRSEILSLSVPTADPEIPYITVRREQVPNLFDPFIETFVTGLASGALDLKNYLLAKRRKYAPLVGGHWNAAALPAKSLPAGVLARMQYCNWN